MTTQQINSRIDDMIESLDSENASFIRASAFFQSMVEVVHEYQSTCNPRMVDHQLDSIEHFIKNFNTSYLVPSNTTIGQKVRYLSFEGEQVATVDALTRTTITVSLPEGEQVKLRWSESLSFYHNSGNSLAKLA